MALTVLPASAEHVESHTPYIFIDSTKPNLHMVWLQPKKQGRQFQCSSRCLATLGVSTAAPLLEVWCGGFNQSCAIQHLTVDWSLVMTYGLDVVRYD